MRMLTRAWQILFKGYEEVAKAGNALQATEMVLVRLAFAADLPTPDDLVAKLSKQPPASGAPAFANAAPRGGPQALRAPAPQPVATEAVAAPALAMPESYAELVALAGAKRDLLLKHALEADIRPVSFDLGRIEVALTERADPGIVQTLSARLKTWTGRPWMVTVSTRGEAGQTIREQKAEREAAHRAEAHDDPLVQAILETFPGAKVVNVQVHSDGTEVPAMAPLPEPDEDD
jgi:DNA polymerase-3 subunit gamma/tau